MTEPSKAVFLSYASQDAEAARRICATLRAEGVEVWLDADGGLEHGDEWDAKIRRQIKECVLFIPLISANTQARHEGYFRLEWDLAAERARLIASGVAFILPVVIDDTREPEALVPDKFRSVQWVRLPKGEMTPEIKARFLKLWSHRTGVLKQEAGTPVGTIPTPVPVRSANGRWAIASAIFVLLAAGVWFWSTRSAPTPSPEPKTLNPTAAASAAALPPIPADKSIAVLPFENRSDDKEASAFFSDGVHEDILTNLGNIRDFRVVSRTSVEQYRNSTKPISQIARELGVAYILEGSVRRAGNKVRVTGQLIRAANETQLWAKSYDSDLTTQEIFVIQTSLAQEIAGAMKTALSPEEQKLVRRRPTQNLSAYEAYLSWRRENNRGLFTAASLGVQQRLLENAVSLDPRFADAWAALAEVHVGFYFQNLEATAARLAQAREAIDAAARLTPDSYEVVRALGRFYYQGSRDYARAMEQFEKLVRLQPNNGESYHSLAAVQRRQGRWAEAMANFRRALELDPSSENATRQLAITLARVRRWPEAIAAQHRLIDQRQAAGAYPDRTALLTDQFSLAQYYYQATGSKVEMEAFVSGLTPEDLLTPYGGSRKQLWQAMSGKFAEALHAGGKPVPGDDLAAAIRTAQLHVATGNPDAARALLENVPAEIRQRLTVEPGNYTLWGRLGMVEALLGRTEDAIRDARQATMVLPETLDPLTGPELSYNLALVYAWTGDKERALAELVRLMRVPSTPNVHLMRNNVATFALRGDPRFEALLNDPKNNAPLF